MPLFIILLIAFIPSPAYAYIDMGTGSMIFQMLVAGFVGAAFTIKMYWHSLKQKIKKLLGRDHPPEDI